MRFTRPGAFPAQVRSESTKLRGCVLGPRVDDERAGAELGSGEVLQLVLRPIRRIELDVEVVMTAATTGRLLMHRHHVRQRLVEEAVVLLEQPLQRRGEGYIVVRVEVGEASTVPCRREMHLVGPSREWRYECDPPIVAQHGMRSGALA